MKNRLTRDQTAAATTAAISGTSPAAATRKAGSVTEVTTCADCEGLTGYGMIETQAYQLASRSDVRTRGSASAGSGRPRGGSTPVITKRRTGREPQVRAGR